MSRLALKNAIIVILLIGFMFFCVPFLSSLGPNEVQKNNAPHFDISRLVTGEKIEFKLPNLSLNITKRKNGEIDAFVIPMFEGVYRLPEFDWQRAVLPCKEFVQVQNYQCTDTEYVWFHDMQWDNSGVYIGDKTWGKGIPNLVVPKFEVIGEHFVLLGLKL